MVTIQNSACFQGPTQQLLCSYAAGKKILSDFGPLGFSCTSKFTTWTSLQSHIAIQLVSMDP